MFSACYQAPCYVCITFSEIFASITGLKYANKKPPQCIKSIVICLSLLTNCFASILAFAFVSATVVSKLTWMYTAISAIAFICCTLVYIYPHKNDKTDVEEDVIGMPSSILSSEGRLQL